VGNFSVAFTGFDEEDPLVAIGELKLGEHSEYFESTLEFWGLEDYEGSWAAGLRRLIDGSSVSCLATSMIDPSIANFVEVWPLYRSGDDVYVQDQLIFMDQLSHEFDPAAPWESVKPRSVINENGQEIQEWRVSLEDVQEFYVRAGRAQGRSQ
jgi:CdiI N-terminal domain